MKFEMKSLSVALCAFALIAGACGEETQVGEPGGMGATPAQRGPDPALEVLGTTDHPAHEDTLIPGAVEREAHPEPPGGSAAPVAPPTTGPGTAN
jgi:hypothetical protein